MNESQQREPVEPDAFLRAALRHAPDREVRPPEALSREILAAARQATRQAAVPRRRPHWLVTAAAACMALLKQPGATAAFASLMLGTLIVVMWRGELPPEAAPGRRAEPSVAQPAPAGSAAQAAMPDVAIAAETAAAAERADQPPAEAPAAAAPAPAARAKTTPRATDKAERRLPAADAQRQAGTALERSAGASETRNADASETRSAGLGAAAMPAAPQATAPAPQLADEAPVSGSAVASARDERSPPPADPLAPALLALHGASADTSLAKQRQLLSQRASEPARAAAAVETAAPAAHPATAWLAELRRLARGRWQRVDAAALPAATELPEVDDRKLGRVAFDADAVFWQPAGSGRETWRAALPPEPLARLRAGLAAWAPPDASAPAASRP